MTNLSQRKLSGTLAVTHYDWEDMDKSLQNSGPILNQKCQRLPLVLASQPHLQPQAAIARAYSLCPEIPSH
jgi:hypothetical protein